MGFEIFLIFFMLYHTCIGLLWPCLEFENKLASLTSNFGQLSCIFELYLKLTFISYHVEVQSVSILYKLTIILQHFQQPFFMKSAPKTFMARLYSTISVNAKRMANQKKQWLGISTVRSTCTKDWGNFTAIQDNRINCRIRAFLQFIFFISPVSGM